MEKRNVPFDAAEDGRRQGEEERPGETGESTPGGGGGGGGGLEIGRRPL